jgi:hypothetical protein
VSVSASAFGHEGLGFTLLSPGLAGFVSNGHAWNVALPDLNSVYHVMLLSLDEGEVVKISATSLPYVRYMSIQSYSIPDFVPR